MAEAARRLLAETGVAAEAIRRAAVYAPDARLAVPILRSLSLGEGVLPQVPLLTEIGNTGVGSPLLALVACLEEAEPGDRILLVGYGSGADALLFEATVHVRDRDRTRGVAAQVAAGRPLRHYGKFLQFRRLVETEPVRAFTGLPVMEREERQNLRLYGQRCAACGAVQYPRRQAMLPRWGSGLPQPWLRALHPEVGPYEPDQWDQSVSKHSSSAKPLSRGMPATFNRYSPMIVVSPTASSMNAPWTTRWALAALPT